MLIFDSISLLISLVWVNCAANVALQVVQRHVALLEQVVELILGIGRLDLGELRVHVFVAGGQVQLGGALLQNLVLDHLVQNIQPPNVGLLG